jgi:predicted nucleic acid-binding protein
VVEERESTALRELLRDDPNQLASALVEVEVVRAVRRAAPELLPQAERVVAQISVVEVSEPIRARARMLDPATVRSLDALHLATALEVGEELDGLISYDARMSQAAKRLGLRVLAPG